MGVCDGNSQGHLFGVSGAARTGRRIRLWIITTLDCGGGTAVLLPEEC